MGETNPADVTGLILMAIAIVGALIVNESLFTESANEEDDE